MEVENPDAELATYMNSLSKKELHELMKECDTIIKKILHEPQKPILKNKTICEILFDY